MRLEALGWNDHAAASFRSVAEPLWEPGRVTSEHQHIYRVALETTERFAVVSGRFRHQAAARESYPAVGDWVAIEERPTETRAVIHAVLPRRSRFSRKVAGDETREQVVAANIDTVFIVLGLDGDFNLNRLQRYLVTVREGGAAPVVVLNKRDVCADTDARVQEAEAVAPDAPVVAMSCRSGEGFDRLEAWLTPASTVALLGSSGTGKSSILNRLLGRDVRRTIDVRARDSRGRHATTHRELWLLPSGALLIDTPGMRELQLWDVGERLGSTFDDIHELGAGCHFRDCQHDEEPKCAVKAAVAGGTLNQARLDYFRQLRREQRHLAAKQDERAELDDKRRAKIQQKALRAHTRQRPR